MNGKGGCIRFVLRGVLILILITLILLAGRAIAFGLTPRSSPIEVTIISPERILPTSDLLTQQPLKQLVIVSEIIALECGINGKVISATFNLGFQGGVPPYHIEFDPGDNVVYDVIGDGSIQFKIEGGHASVATAKSNTPGGEPKDSQYIVAPEKDADCEQNTSTALPTLIFTLPPPSITESLPTLPTSISVPTEKTESHPDSEIGVPPPTDPPPTDPPPTDPPPTDPPPTDPPPTDPPPTDPPPTDPPPTDPPPTDPPPQPNPTRTPIVLRECNDGQDNDGDGFIDMEDSGCKWRFDNSE